MTDAELRDQAAVRLAERIGTEVAKQYLRDLGLSPAARYLDECERRRVIRSMRALREPVADIRAELVRMGMSRSSAYDLVADELSRNRPEFGRAPEKMSP